MVRVLGIGGWDRSGSTIVAGVLGAAPEVVSVGEISNLWERGVVEDRLCGCGARFGVCDFWKPVMDRAFGDDQGRIALEGAIEAQTRLGNARLIAGREALVGSDARCYARALSRIYAAIGEAAGAEVIVDSSKTPWHLALADAAESVEFSMLHLVRDPRGVAYSLSKTMDYDPDVEHPRRMDRHGPVFTVLGWRYRNRIISRMWGGRPDYLVLRYEDFAADPRRVTEDLLRRMAIPVDRLPFTSASEVELPVIHSVSGNPVRFQDGPVEIRLDERWRTRMPASDRAAVTTLAGHDLERYGYRP